MTRKKGLGRGLSALLADTSETTLQQAVGTSGQTVPIELVHPNPDQPRRSFNREDLESLTASVAEKGIIQPLIVRRDPRDDTIYQIVAGERRWRAAQKAQLHEIPVIVMELDDREVLELAIIENIQRADLNPIEEATGYRQLMDRFGHTQEALAQALGKSRSHIANTLRLLSLPDTAQNMVRGGKLTAGHARTLLTADDPAKLAERIIDEGLSVRDAEKLARTGTHRRPRPRRGEKDADTKSIEAELSAALDTRVLIEANDNQSGTLKIMFKDVDKLDGICRLLLNN